MAQSRINGSMVPLRGNKPHRLEGNRVCGVRGCHTQLSRYNYTDKCWIHVNAERARNRHAWKEPDEEMA